MNVLMVNLEIDCAGVSWNLTQAINAIPGHVARHVVHKPTYVAQNTHLFFQNAEEIVSLCEWADVIHFNNWIWTHKPTGEGWRFFAGNAYGADGNPFEPFLKNKRIVFHFHGGAHQLRPEYWLRECARVGAVVLKCDPICPIKGARWIPNVLDIEPGEQVDCGAPIRVAVMGPIDDIRRNNRHIALVLKEIGIEHKFFGDIPRARALVERRGYQVSIDNLTQGFIGMWGWESLAMGQATMARVDDADYVGAFGEQESLWNIPPWINTKNVDCIAAELRDLDKDRDLLGWVSYQSVAWMKKHYSPAAIAAKYLEVYAQ